MDALSKRKELEAIGGPAYLAYLTEGIPRNLNIETYVRIIKDKSLLRQLLEHLQRGHGRGVRPGGRGDQGPQQCRSPVRGCG